MIRRTKTKKAHRTDGSNRGRATERGPDSPLTSELERRMRGPQRHRLLQGFPMSPLMRERAEGVAPVAPFDLPVRPLLIGVLPHSYCNPRVKGCGFCTFAHQPYRNDAARTVTERVAREIETLGGAGEALTALPVEALYFGGGTANLTPPDSFDALCRALGGRFDLSDAEVTLEGVPIYFDAHDGALMRSIVDRLGPRQPRISMGVQTFDEARLRQMGRQHFGTRQQIARTVSAARAAGWTTSADLLLNLPHQPVEAMLDDLHIAMELGFDQICIYHLVLYPGLGTAWSEEPEMLAGLPDSARAFESWSAARQALLDRGFVQTTLTNFERGEVHRSSGRFRYEAASFTPWGHHAVGFGPGALSTLSDADSARGIKWMSSPDAERYAERVDREGYDRSLVFAYETRDLELLHLTRGLAGLAIDRPAHASRFGSDVAERLGSELHVLAEARLLVLDEERLALTPRGMFYADSVAGLLAWRRASALAERGSGRLYTRDGKRRLPANAAAPHSMG